MKVRVCECVYASMLVCLHARYACIYIYVFNIRMTSQTGLIASSCAVKPSISVVEHSGPALDIHVFKSSLPLQ